MTGNRNITLDDAELLFGTRMGLVCGANVTGRENLFEQLNTLFASQFEVKQGDNYTATVQNALDKGVLRQDVMKAAAKYISKAPKSDVIARLASLKWSAALTLTLDEHFSDEFSRASNKNAVGGNVTQVNEFPKSIPPYTLPVFQLLGSLDKEGCVLSKSDYRSKKSSWRYATRDFIDKIKDAPVVLLGVNAWEDALLDLLSEMLSNSKTIPTAFLFLRSEFDDAQRRHIEELLSEKCQLGYIDASVIELVNRLKTAAKARYSPPLIFASGQNEYEKLEPYSDIAVVVNSQLKAKIKANETTQLLDLLFSPNLARWEPFNHNLDFKRSLTNQVFDSVTKQLPSNANYSTHVIIGSTASGKTTLIKRLAYDLAQKNHFVLWFKPTLFPNATALLNQLFKQAYHHVNKSKQKAYFFVDDIHGLGSISLINIVRAAQTTNIDGTFVLSARTVDWKTSDMNQYNNDLSIAKEYVLPDGFDAQELRALPNYLVSLKIVPNKTEADKDIRRFSTGMAGDTLGLLYWLIPNTRQYIESGIKDEFDRLKVRAGLSSVIIGGFNRTTDFLRRAYAFVAVADHYKTPLPMEVLVSALDVTYGEWIDAIGKDGPAWGLLYGEPSTNDDTTCYRPRNSIITKTLIESINGGKLAHSGEVNLLLELIKGCDGTNNIYREFCVSILVPYAKIQHLSYVDGLSLYDAALNALPQEDRTLKHQKGLWIKNKGNDPLFAAEVMIEALRSSSYPYTSRGEADEHIHTSVAAAFLEAADSGKLDVEDAKYKIIEHLDKARSSTFFNANAVHVQANTILRLMPKLAGIDSADTLQLLNQALLSVDSTLSIIRNPYVGRLNRPDKDIELLEEISGKIFGQVATIDELELRAEELWNNYGRQDGFIIAARRRHYFARHKDTGTAYNEAFAYCKHLINIINAKGSSVSPDLYAVATDIYFGWNINRINKKNTPRTIDWDILLEYCKGALSSERYNSDPLYKFISAIALAHLKDWDTADAIFSQIRKMPLPAKYAHKIRATLLDDDGTAKQWQGEITGGKNHKYAKVSLLKPDFNLSTYDRWPNVGEIVHFYIGFSFLGPMGVMQL